MKYLEWSISVRKIAIKLQLVTVLNVLKQFSETFLEHQIIDRKSGSGKKNRSEYPETEKRIV